MPLFVAQVGLQPFSSGYDIPIPCGSLDLVERLSDRDVFVSFLPLDLDVLTTMFRALGVVLREDQVRSSDAIVMFGVHHVGG